MAQPQLTPIKGTMTNLQKWDGEESFVMGSGTKAVGGAAAVGAAAAGLAGVAASAAINMSDTEDPVEFFTCTLDDKAIFGRFGTVSFKDGNEVVMAVEEHAEYWEAYAVCRPKDRCIWMYPHCSRGIRAYWVVNIKRIVLGSVIVSQIAIAILGLFFLFDDDPDWSLFLKLWTYFTPGVIGMLSVILGGVALYLSKSAYLASTIFKALDFKNPNKVDLEKRLKTYLANNKLSDQERRQYSFYSRWVYRY